MDRETVRRAVIDIFGGWGHLCSIAQQSGVPGPAEVSLLLTRILKPEETLHAISNGRVESELTQLGSDRPQYTGEYYKALPHAAALADAVKRAASEAVDSERYRDWLVSRSGCRNEPEPFDPTEVSPENCARVLSAVADPALLHGSPERWIQAAEIELAALPESTWGHGEGPRRSKSTATKGRRVTSKVLESAVAQYLATHQGPPRAEEIAEAIGYPKNVKAVRGTVAFKRGLKQHGLNRPPRGKRPSVKVKSLDSAGYDGAGCVAEGSKHKGHVGAGYAGRKMQEHREEIELAEGTMDHMIVAERERAINESLRESEADPSPLSPSRKKYVRG